MGRLVGVIEGEEGGVGDTGLSPGGWVRGCLVGSGGGGKGYRIREVGIEGGVVGIDECWSGGRVGSER